VGRGRTQCPWTLEQALVPPPSHGYASSIHVLTPLGQGAELGSVCAVRESSLDAQVIHLRARERQRFLGTLVLIWNHLALASKQELLDAEFGSATTLGG